METPKVKFIYAYPLDVNRRRLYSEKELGYYPSIEEIKEKINHWEELWNKTNENDKVILKLTELAKRIPERSLECFVFGGGINPISTPFLMPVMGYKQKDRSDEKFIETFIHELAHIFVSGVTKYFEMIREKYNMEPVLVQNHIIIYAMLEKIYLDLFDSKPGDFESKDLPQDYERAVEIVKEGSYENFINEYQELV
jgi:hypothetical protein